MGWKYKRLAASGLVYTGACQIGGINIKGGSDEATIAIADKVSSGGDGLIHGEAAANTVVDAVLPSGGVSMTTAAYATITGTTPVINIYYKPKLGSV